jgi:hypothetical protein
MNKITKIKNDLRELKTDSEVLGYWDNRSERILDCLKNLDSDFEDALEIIHRLAKSLNSREKYSAVYYLYTAGYQPIESNFKPSDVLNEVKYELARGLLHNRKQEHSKRLFEELTSTGFDISRIEDWHEQAQDKETNKLKAIYLYGLPALFNAVIIVVFNFVFKFNNPLIETRIVLVLFFIVVEILVFRIVNLYYLKKTNDYNDIQKVKQVVLYQLLIALLLLFAQFAFPKTKRLIYYFPLTEAIISHVVSLGYEYQFLPKAIEKKLRSGEL